VTDLFGTADPGESIPGDLFEGMNQGMREALAQLREKAHAAERAARLRPDDRDLQRRAARTRREYLQLRDHARNITAEELAAERIAAGDSVPLPADNRELFDPDATCVDDHCPICGEYDSECLCIEE
jgi:hypothetical protein